MSLVLFDLDNTLLGGDSDHSWGEFLVEHDLVDANQYRQRNDEFYHAYQQGQLNILDYLEFAVEPLTRFNPTELSRLHNTFMLEKIEPIRLPKAEALIEKHRKAGDELAIITATNRFITEPIASLFGIKHLMATELEKNDDGYTGKIIDEPCYQHGKLIHLDKWLSQQPYDLSDSFFYSDSFNDLPLLSKVTHPIAVDPDPKLEAHAKQNGWEILSLRN
ncbi:MAG: HAD-IB family hydrolase [Cellvibrionaceae bacterium]